MTSFYYTYYLLQYIEASKLEDVSIIIISETHETLEQRS